MENIDEKIRDERRQAEKEERKIFLKAQGKHIARLRKQRGLSQFEFGSEVNLVINSVSKIERGLADTRIYTLYKIAKVLDVSLAEVADFKIDKIHKTQSSNQKLIEQIVEILKFLDEEKLKIIKRQIEAFNL